MATWTTQTRVAGLPNEVLALLTEPDAIARWAPISFDVVDFDRKRLRAGDRVHVRGGLGARALEFAATERARWGLPADRHAANYDPQRQAQHRSDAPGRTPETRRDL